MKVAFLSSLNSSIFLSYLLLLLLRTWLAREAPYEVGVGCESNQRGQRLSHPPHNSNAFGTIKLHSPEKWNSFVILDKNSVLFEICFYFFIFSLKKMAVFSSVKSVAQQNFVSADCGLYSLPFYPLSIIDTLFINTSLQRKICICAVFIYSYEMDLALFRAFFSIFSHFISNHYWSSFYFCIEYCCSWLNRDKYYPRGSEQIWIFMTIWYVYDWQGIAFPKSNCDSIPETKSEEPTL